MSASTPSRPTSYRGITGGFFDIFVHDLQSRTTAIVSVNSTGDQANSHSNNPVVSEDGRFVAFASVASNLVPDDTHCICAEGYDVFVHDRDTDKDAIFDEPEARSTARVSVDSAGNEGTGPQGSYSPSIGADGRLVAFESFFSNLVAGDTNNTRDVFVHDLGDADGDGQWDPFDNCPAWFNPSQNLPPWPVPLNDPDCDGFGTAAENFMGTLPLDPCADTLGADNEDPPDAWPFDFDDNQRAGLSDVLGYIPVFNTYPIAPYDPRYDLDQSGGIRLADVLSFIPVFNKVCTP